MKQKAIAAKVLKCGLSRVWIDPSRISDVKEAITSEDVRHLIKDGVIRARPKKGLSRGRKAKAMKQKKKGRRKGIGSRKGTAHARSPSKTQWIKRIRALRKLLRELRDQGSIDGRTYRKVYRIAKSGFLRNRSHLMTHLERNNLLKKKPVKEKEGTEGKS